MFCGDVVEDSGREEYGAAGRVDLVHPAEVVEIAGDILLALSGRKEFVPDFYDIREIQVISGTSPVVCSAERVVQAASHIDDGCAGVMSEVCLHLAAQIILALGNLQRAEESGRGFHALSFISEVIVQ